MIYIKIISFDLEKELLRGKIYDKYVWFEVLVFYYGSCYFFFWGRYWNYCYIDKFFGNDKTSKYFYVIVLIRFDFYFFIDMLLKLYVLINEMRIYRYSYFNIV